VNSGPVDSEITRGEVRPLKIAKIKKKH